MNQVPIGNRPVRLPDRRSSAEAVRITGLIFGVAAPFIAYMWVSAAQLKGEYHLSRLVEERRKLTKEHERLSLTRDALLEPALVDRTAREKLGMVDEDPAEMNASAPPPAKKADAPPPAAAPPAAKPARPARRRSR